jgi:hypothetical protein
MSLRRCWGPPATPYDEEATGETLRAAALALVGDAEVARRLKELRAASAQEGGTRRAADLIEAEPAAAQAAGASQSCRPVPSPPGRRHTATA